LGCSPKPAPADLGELLLQPPCPALGSGCRHSRAWVLSVCHMHGAVPLVADTTGVPREKGMNFYLY